MTAATRFVATRTLSGLDLVRVDDRPVLDGYEHLRRVLRERCGDTVAGLFAEPIVSRSNGAAPARVDWYTNLDGQIQPLANLDRAHADRVGQRIRAALAAMEPVLRDSEVGPLAAACLNLASPQAVLVVGDAPLLIDWGMLPQGFDRDERGRVAHYASTLSAFAPANLPYPPIGRDDWERRFKPLATAGSETPLRPIRIPAGWPMGGVASPLVATTAAAALLALSLVPGVLVFPTVPVTTSAEARTLQTAWLDGLRRRRDTLVAAEGLACPRLRTELPALVPQSPAGVRLPIDQGAPPQSRAAVDGPAQGTAPSTAAPDGLADRLERSTVLVLAGNATGSGFFVADDLVVTNRHVVEGASSLMIAGRHAGLAPATLVQAGSAGTLNDFALLRVSPRAGGRPLPLARPGRPLTPVVAAGFPGLHLGTDPTFARLRDGDAEASRELTPVLQTGVVNHLQRFDEAAVTLVLHGAEIAPGNSGGPLVDYCGRVVGVNTFGRTDDRLPVTARYALGADGLAAFLSRAGVNAAPDERSCDLQAPPRVAAASPAETATPAAAPAEGTPAGQSPTRTDARPAPRTGRDIRPPAR